MVEGSFGSPSAFDMSVKNPMHVRRQRKAEALKHASEVNQEWWDRISKETADRQRDRQRQEGFYGGPAVSFAVSPPVSTSSLSVRADSMTIKDELHDMIDRLVGATKLGRISFEAVSDEFSRYTNATWVESDSDES